MISALKATIVTGIIGLAAVAWFGLLLSLEKGAHAKTKQALASEKALVADIRSQNATQAAERAEAVADNVARMQAQIDAFIESEGSLRRSLSETRRLRQADREDADQRIERLKRENEELQAWAATLVPDDWVDFMREPADEATAAAAGSP